MDLFFTLYRFMYLSFTKTTLSLLNVKSEMRGLQLFKLFCFFQLNWLFISFDFPNELLFTHHTHKSLLEYSEWKRLYISSLLDDAYPSLEFGCLQIQLSAEHIVKESLIKIILYYAQIFFSLLGWELPSYFFLSLSSVEIEYIHLVFTFWCLASLLNVVNKMHKVRSFLLVVVLFGINIL